MSDSRASLAQVIREVAAEDREKAGPTPSAEEILAYASAELSGSEAERLGERILADPESRDVVLGIKAFPQHEPPSEEYRISDAELDDAWARMQAELGITSESEQPGRAAQTPEPSLNLEPSPTREPERGRREPAPAPWWARLRQSWLKPVFRPAMMPAALAASFILGIFSAGAWNRDAPYMNVEVLDLVPKGQVLRSGGERMLTFSRDAGPSVLILSLSDLARYSAYVVEVVGAGDRVVWSDQGSRRTSAGYLTISMPRGFLDTGEYEVRLFDSEPDPRRLVEAYPFRITP